MIVLDTNVISELFRPAPDPDVVGWFTACPADELFTSAITRGELLFGAHILPAGRRKDALLAGLLRIFDVRFPSRVLPYD